MAYLKSACPLTIPLPVKNLDGTYRLVQDLRVISQVVESKHPDVPNPYTVLSKIPHDHWWFSVVGLKDNIWACPLAEKK
jgi:hypothetical protein